MKQDIPIDPLAPRTAIAPPSPIKMSGSQVIPDLRRTEFTPPPSTYVKPAEPMKNEILPPNDCYLKAA